MLVSRYQYMYINARDENVNDIIQVVPLKKEYIAFLREENRTYMRPM